MSGGTAPKGLEDVVVTSSSLTLIDASSATLSHRGYDISDLAENANFEEIVHLLWYGNLPTALQLKELNERLIHEREIPDQMISLMRCFPKEAHPMDILRTAVSALSAYDPDKGEYTPEAMMRRSIRILAKVATIIASSERIRNDEELVAPHKELSHASNFLYMLNGEVPSESAARTFDRCLVLHADHELNASTFAARVTASTLSDVYSAVTSAIGALKGPLHGGANEAVMEMLETIGRPERAEEFVRRTLKEKRRVMGFGHRVYKTIDPRAVILRRLSRELAEMNGAQWYEISHRIEEMMMVEKNLSPNVDFYAASVYRMIGIPTHLFTPIFACSRVAGWCAHVLEQYSENRLIRPRAEYVGHPRRKYIPFDERE